MAAGQGELPDPVNPMLSDIDITEDAINKCFYRLEILEKSLKYRPMGNDERQKTERDIAEIKRLLLQEEKKLRALRQRGKRVSVMVAVIVLIGTFLVFGLFKMYSNIGVGMKTPTTLHF